MMGNDWSGVGMGFGGISMVLIWAALILALVGVAWYLRGDSRPARAKSDDARGILAERYARGEIGTEEFRRARRELGE